MHFGLSFFPRTVEVNASSRREREILWIWICAAAAAKKTVFLPKLGPVPAFVQQCKDDPPLRQVDILTLAKLSLPFLVRKSFGDYLCGEMHPYPPTPFEIPPARCNAPSSIDACVCVQFSFSGHADDPIRFSTGGPPGHQLTPLSLIQTYPPVYRIKISTSTFSTSLLLNPVGHNSPRGGRRRRQRASSSIDLANFECPWSHTHTSLPSLQSVVKCESSWQWAG